MYLGGLFLFIDDLFGWKWIFLTGFSMFQFGRIEILNAIDEIHFFLLLFDCCKYRSKNKIKNEINHLTVLGPRPISMLTIQVWQWILLLSLCMLQFSCIEMLNARNEVLLCLLSCYIYSGKRRRIEEKNRILFMNFYGLGERRQNVLLKSNTVLITLICLSISMHTRACVCCVYVVRI